MLERVDVLLETPEEPVDAGLGGQFGLTSAGADADGEQQPMALVFSTNLQHSLAQTAQQLGKSQAELIRQAIAEYLERHAPKREFASLGAGEDNEFSARDTDEYLKGAWGQR